MKTLRALLFFFFTASAFGGAVNPPLPVGYNGALLGYSNGLWVPMNDGGRITNILTGVGASATNVFVAPKDSSVTVVTNNGTSNWSIGANAIQNTNGVGGSVLLTNPATGKWVFFTNNVETLGPTNAAAKITLDGGDGTVTATSFSGSGASLTGVIANNSGIGTNTLLYNASDGNVTMNNISRTMWDSSGGESVDFANRFLVDSSGLQPSLDWRNRALMDSSGLNTLLWSSSGVRLAEGIFIGDGSGLSNIVAVSSFSSLNSSASVGDTAITVKGLPPGVAPGAGWIIIEPFSLNAEVRQVSSVVGNTINLTGASSFPLLYAHANGCQVMWDDGRNLGLSWAVFGGVAGVTGSVTASNNALGFNRAITNFYKLTGFGPGGILIPGGGAYYINDELRPQSGMAIRGSTPDIAIIRADASGSAVFTNAERALIHLWRDTTPTTTTNGGPLSRLYLDHVLVDGNNVGSANGILVSIQQPQAWYGVRVNNCPGLGLHICSAQDAYFNRTEFINNGTNVEADSCSMVVFDDLNSEQAVTKDMVWGAIGGLYGYNNTVRNLHCEMNSPTQTNISVEVFGTEFTFDRVWFTNPDTNGFGFYFHSMTNQGQFGYQGNTIIHLYDVHANIPSDLWKLYLHEDSGQSKTVNQAQRIITKEDFMPTYAGDNQHNYIGISGDKLAIGVPKASFTGGAFITATNGSGFGQYESFVRKSDGVVLHSVDNLGNITDAGTNTSGMAISGNYQGRTGTWSSNTNAIDFNTNGWLRVTASNVCINGVLNGPASGRQSCTLLASNLSGSAFNMYALNSAFRIINGTNGTLMPVAAGQVGLVTVEVWAGTSTNIYFGQQTF